MAAVGELAEHVAVAVLDPGDEERIGVFALGREGVVGGDHLIHGEVRRADAQGDDRVDPAADAHLVHHGHHRLRAQLLHQPGGHGVGALGEAPAEVHHGPAGVRVLRRPGLVAVHDQHLRHVEHLVAGGHAGFHCEGIEEGLDGGTHLPLALPDVVILEIPVVGAAHVGADVARTRLDGHEGRPEEGLVVADGVVRGHERIDIARLLPGEQAHGHFLREALRDLRVGIARGLHHPVAVAPAAGLVHGDVHHLLVRIVRERRMLAGADLLPEGLLQVLAQVLDDRLLGVALHLVVDGGIDAEAVLVQVIRRTVALEVLVQPAVQRVVGPGEGVHAEVLHGGVGLAPGALGGHRPAQHVPEVRAYAGGAVHAAGMQFDGELPEGVALRLRQIVLVPHAPEDQVAALQGLVRVDGGVVARGLVHHAHQDGALLHLQVDGILAEELQGSGLDAVGVGAEENRVQVHVHDFLLRVVALQLDRGDPLAELDPDHVQLGGVLLAGVEGLRQLLGDGGAATLAGIAGQERLEQDAEQAGDVDAGMVVETGVLGGDRRLHEVQGKLVIAHEGPVLDMVGRQDLAFLGDDLGGQLAVRVLELFDGRDLGEGPDDPEQDKDQGDRGQKQDPEPADDLLACIVCHLKFLSLCTRP